MKYLDLEVGKVYKNRRGQKCKVLATDYAGPCGVSVVLQILGIGSEPDKVMYCYNDGRQLPASLNRSHVLDLVSEYREPRYRWLNIYESEPGISYFETKEEANLVSQINGVTSHCINCIRIDLNSGEIKSEDI